VATTLSVTRMLTASSELASRDYRWLTACHQLAPVFSTCQRRQYAAFLVDPHGRVAGFGYNGSPPGHAHCEQAPCPRLGSDVPHGSPYDSGAGRCIAVHAEANALLFSDATARRGATCYVNGPPCADCAKLLVAGGVVRVVHTFDAAYPDACVELGLETVAVPMGDWTP
jgi:dCMP deaminase